MPRDIPDGKASASNAETQIRSLGREDPLEKGMATHSNIPAMDGGAGRATVPGVAKSQIRPCGLAFSLFPSAQDGESPASPPRALGTWLPYIPVHLGFLPLAAPYVVTVWMLQLLVLHSFITTAKTESAVSSQAFLSSGRRTFAKSFFSRLPIASHSVIIIFFWKLMLFIISVLKSLGTMILGTLFKV